MTITTSLVSTGVYALNVFHFKNLNKDLIEVMVKKIIAATKIYHDNIIL